MIKKNSRVFFVVKENEKFSYKKHPSLKSAIKESERLKSLNQGQTFYAVSGKIAVAEPAF